MGRHKKSESQKEADKKGKARIKKYEENKLLSKKESVDNESSDTKVITCFQKKDSGEWEKINYEIKK